MMRPQPRGAWATRAEEAGGSPPTSDFCLETSVPAAGRNTGTGGDTKHNTGRCHQAQAVSSVGTSEHTKFIIIFLISWTRLGPKVT